MHCNESGFTRCSSSVHCSAANTDVDARSTIAKANLRIPLHLSGFLRHDVCAHGLRGNHRSGTAKFLAVSESMKALSASSADGSMITLLHRPSPWSMMISFCVPSSMARACFRISGTVACTTGAFGCSPGGLMYAQATASIRDFNMIVTPFPLHGRHLALYSAARSPQPSLALSPLTYKPVAIGNSQTDHIREL